MSTTDITAAQIVGYLDERAVGLLAEYFAPAGRFTGGRFERFAGGGARVETANRFTSDDIVAVSLLGVRIPGRAALRILEDEAQALNALLGEIPQGTDLWMAPEDAVGPRSAADQLWAGLVALPGIQWVTAGKLLARKRPRLIPVYDRVVKAALGRKDDDGWWLPLRAALAANPQLVTDLAGLRKESGLGDEVSLLRVLDVCIWMREYGQPEPVPDAET